MPRPLPAYRRPDAPSAPSWSIPRVRPNGHDWMATELRQMREHIAYLQTLNKQQRFALDKMNGRQRKELAQAGWTPVLPGLWVAQMKGPMRTQDAIKRIRDEEHYWKRMETDRVAPDLQVMGWVRVGPLHWEAPGGKSHKTPNSLTTIQVLAQLAREKA